MSVVLYNKHTGKIAECRRTNWVSCQDHLPSKGWELRIHLPRSVSNVEELETTFDDTSTSLEEYSNADSSGLSEYAVRAQILRDKNIAEIRSLGLGSNFMVINQADGFRKDNKLWIGECAECGGRVTNSNLNGIWTHSKVTKNEDGSTSSQPLYSCPKADIKHKKYVTCGQCGEEISASREKVEAEAQGEVFVCTVCADV